MTLEEYLESNSISVADFAEQIGAKSRVTVYRYMKNNKKHRVPNPKMMLRILRATNGEVTPTDFFKIPKRNNTHGRTNTSASVRVNPN